MGTWKLTAVALVCGLVFCGAASAATMTLTIEIQDYATGAPIDPATLVAGNVFGVAIYAEVAGVPGGYGIANASWTIYTPDTTGVASAMASLGKVVTTWGTTIDYNAKVPAAPKDFADPLDPDLDAEDAVGSAVSGFNSTDIGVVKTLMQRQKWQMLAGGSGQLAIYADDRGEYIDEGAGDYTTQFELVVSGSVVKLGPSASGPTIVIDTANRAEGDWTDPNPTTGWCDDDRQVSIESTITDGPAAVLWTLANPNAGGSTQTLAATGEDFTLTMAEINALFGAEVPLAGGIAGFNYDWTLTASVDGGNSTDSITVFVPEPATMGLLAFGVVGLLRRRRRA